MKKAFIVLLLTFTIIRAFPQMPDCSKFKTGTFKMTFGNNNVIIKRTSTTQSEYLNGATVPATFHIKWIGKCTYTLVPDAAMEKNFPNAPKTLVITTNIVKTTNNAYTAKVTANLNEKVFTNVITKIADH